MELNNINCDLGMTGFAGVSSLRYATLPVTGFTVGVTSSHPDSDMEVVSKVFLNANDAKNANFHKSKNIFI